MTAPNTADPPPAPSLTLADLLSRFPADIRDRLERIAAADRAKWQAVVSKDQVAGYIASVEHESAIAEWQRFRDDLKFVALYALRAVVEDDPGAVISTLIANVPEFRTAVDVVLRLVERLDNVELILATAAGQGDDR